MPQFVISGPPVCNICDIEFKRTGREDTRDDFTFIETKRL